MKKMLMLAVAAAMVAACSSDDNNGTPTDPQTADGLITSLTDIDYDATSLKGYIAGNITLPAGEYTLDGALTVLDGFTLTLEPGVKFIANTSGAQGGTNVRLQVNKGGKLMAVGTASQPIVFTSDTEEPGDWAGVFLCGKATLTSPNGGRDGSYTQATEIGDASYGGSDDADSSGHLEYVEIAYAGARINGTKEGNNLSLYAQGTGTILKNLWLHDGSDDNIEFFGGTVNAENLLVVNSADDTFDWCLGWNGHVTNVVEIREAGFTDITNGSGMMEGDGFFSDLGSTPANTANLSNPTLTNFSIGVYGASGTDSADPNSTAYKLRAVALFRTGCKISLTNSKVIWGDAVNMPTNGLFKFNDATGPALAADVHISLNYTGPSFIGGTGVTTSPDSPVPGANYNLSGAYPAYIYGDFAQLVFNNTGATGADKSVFAWTNYDFATKAPGL
ncbi:hypothetical protein [Flavobacterium silvaticum]|uniref:Lipoprotein n=1 Tax=Flavobacterium silvaticum TaxID=1852020 RepID=A0A972JG09_9FLAO|nr:hypothetical protein [Flavobacterium silvaticum]NMH28544.1 hypothetical protein [Flavobacterium silvaticum]